MTVLDRATRLISMMDGECSDYMEELFKKWGIAILFSSTVESIAAKGDALAVKLSNGNRLFPDTVLFAAGRVANTEGLGLRPPALPWIPAGESSWTGTFVPLSRIFDAGDVLAPTWHRLRWSKGEPLSVMPLEFRSKGSSIRVRSPRSTACRKFLERGSLRSNVVKKKTRL